MQLQHELERWEPRLTLTGEGSPTLPRGRRRAKQPCHGPNYSIGASWTRALGGGQSTVPGRSRPDLARTTREWPKSGPSPRRASKRRTLKGTDSRSSIRCAHRVKVTLNALLIGPVTSAGHCHSLPTKAEWQRVSADIDTARSVMIEAHAKNPSQIRTESLRRFAGTRTVSALRHCAGAAVGCAAAVLCGDGGPGAEAVGSRAGEVLGCGWVER